MVEILNTTLKNPMIGIPVAKPFKRLVSALAKKDRRTPTEYARLVLEEGVNAKAKEQGLDPVPAS